MVDVNKIVEPYYDLGNLLLIDRDPVEGTPTPDEAKLLEITRNNVQLLYNKIWDLPRKVVQDATCAQLPDPDFSLPREKPIPKPREATKWEKFAQSKGIVKNKDRSHKVWDDTAQDWKPRYGYRRGNDNTKDWLIEIPDQKDPYKDYFTERVDAKKERVNKNEMQRLRNIARSVKGTGGNSENVSMQNNGEVAQTPNKQKQFGANKGSQYNKMQNQQQNQTPMGVRPYEEKSRDELSHQLHRAKQSTASLGKFQESIKGEKPPKNLGKKRKFEPNEGNAEAEKDRQLKILENLQAKKPKLIASKFHAVDEHLRREERAEKDDETDGDGKSFRKKAKTGGRRSAGGDRNQNRTKSQINRQQKFQSGRKGGSGGNTKGGNSKAGKARSRQSGKRG